MDQSAISIHSNVRCYNFKRVSHLAKAYPIPDNCENAGGSRSHTENRRSGLTGGRGLTRGANNFGGLRDRGMCRREIVIYYGGWQEIMLVEDDGLDGFWDEGDVSASRSQSLSFEDDDFGEDDLERLESVERESKLGNAKECDISKEAGKGSKYGDSMSLY